MQYHILPLRSLGVLSCMLAGVIHTTQPCILVLIGPGVLSCMLEGKVSVIPSPSCILAQVILALITLAQEVFLL